MQGAACEDGSSDLLLSRVGAKREGTGTDSLLSCLQSEVGEKAVGVLKQKG